MDYFCEIEFEMKELNSSQIRRSKLHAIKG